MVDQVRVAMSTRPVPAADESSVTRRPVNPSRIQSLSPTHHRAAVQTAGSCEENHRSLTSGDMGCTGVPVTACSVSARPSRCTCSASRRARASAQVMTGVNGRSSPSRASNPCMAAPTETPRTVAPAVARTHSASASVLARRIAIGSSTCWPGSGASSGYSRRATARHGRSMPNAAALTPVVPTSRPIITRSEAARRLGSRETGAPDTRRA